MIPSFPHFISVVTQKNLEIGVTVLLILCLLIIELVVPIGADDIDERVSKITMPIVWLLALLVAVILVKPYIT